MNATVAERHAKNNNNRLNTPLPDSKQRSRLRRWRAFKDTVAHHGVGLGGVGVVIALALIFVYLVLEVLPMFGGASAELEQSYPAPGPATAETAALAIERYQTVATRFTREGEVAFFEIASGDLLMEESLPLPEGVQISSFRSGEPRSGEVAYGLSDGTAIVAKPQYDITYPGGRRAIAPKLAYPLGDEPVVVDPEGQPITAIAVQAGSTGTAIAAATEDNRLLLVLYTSTVSFMTGETQVRRTSYELQPPPGAISQVLINSTRRNLFVADTEGNLHYYDVSNPGNANLVDTQRVLANPDATVTAMNFLLGTVSIIVGGSDGSISQWFLVREQRNIFRLTRVRDFKPHAAAVLSITPEHNRKGFATGAADGTVGVHFATSGRTLLMEKFADAPIQELTLSPINRMLLALDGNNELHVIAVDNPHPQVSFSALWGKVWYEGRAAPDYVWQASSATDEFEPKFSLVPLSIGTLKAAFYAMLVAMPLAIMGAIYTAYFMTPKLRGMVKPTIEVMEALPTVILGFLAGLWLAPYVENNLPAVFSILILTPIGMLALAFAWSKLPDKVRHTIPPGWEAAVLVPIVLGIGWGSVALSPLIEIWLFDGSARQWLTDVGITYDQRNALVVGIAMGFAVIPTIFSITEDAIFSVPKHLTHGSLALGATPWQTVTRVVLLTASPGIFSAIMIGFGRAVGETMIVLMATGNSPVVNFNIFEGMRTLSANVAVELPETAVDSTHYRILFLAALLLFLLTFVLNTLAEIVRQRLRKKYSSL